ncbi:Protein of unknown function [Prosthecobacter debontii]|uniref:Tat (Twin-arginine translocation) pathway signal sequence n=1 Tax=Prosthecobacter debontii TaxID=48467 RepID=A0A1T4YCZ1_9BACT|nr:DUF1501 domain-containing protein [Prosthecobacter debontii]SKA99580.1 Protein of unknown function [Prosthecobacter debontii]
MKTELLRLNDQSRRQFMLNTAKTALGVSVLPGLSARMAAAEGAAVRTGPGTPGFGKAKHVIYLWMNGGMTHLDTFDPKTGSTKGPSDPIKAKAEGIDFLGGYLPKLAENANKLSIIRSMSSKTGVHESGTYIMKTGYEPRTTIVHPCMGVWATHFLGKIKDVTLPDSVIVNSGSSYPGSGFFPPALSPIPISNPENGLQNIRPTTSDNLFSKRIDLMNEFDTSFRKKFQTDDVKAYTEFYDETLKLMKSEDLKAFDLSAESAETREKYGRNNFGQGCLLARRLVEAGVRFVEVQMGGWDMHNTIDNAMTNNGNILDTAFAALLLDLEAKGLLDSTLVVLGSEFGRTPDINENDGRDHYPLAYSTVLAGGGVKRGFAYGATDKDGRRPADKQTSPQDFLATVGHAMGLPTEEIVMSPSNRPFTVADKGVPVIDIFA